MNDVVKAPNRAHLFKPGQSGNPNGRPKGSRNAISLVKVQVEGELRARMRGDMDAVLKEIIRQALPSQRTDPKTGQPMLDEAGKPVLLAGNQEMLKLLYKSWVSGTKATDEEPDRQKIQIVIGKLDQVPTVSGKVFTNNETEE